MEESETIIDVILLENGVDFPDPIPISPADTQKDAPEEDGHDAREQDQLDPVDDVEREHVDERPAVGGNGNVIKVRMFSLSDLYY